MEVTTESLLSVRSAHTYTRLRLVFSAGCSRSVALAYFENRKMLLLLLLYFV